MYWLQQHGIALPERVDGDLNLTGNDAVFTSPGAIITHFLDDIEGALSYFYPNQPLRYGLPEVGHSLDPTRRYEEGKAWGPATRKTVGCRTRNRRRACPRCRPGRPTCATCATCNGSRALVAVVVAGAYL